MMVDVKVMPFQKDGFFSNTDTIWKRALFFDPTEVYKRIEVDFYKRRHFIKTCDAFPKIDDHCACGCGRKLPQYKIKWFEKECGDFAYLVCCVINGRVEEIKILIGRYYLSKCKKCEKDLKVLENSNLDHIVPVYAGGGACWLNNYQFLCIECHKEKTKQDYKLYKRKQNSLTPTKQK